MQKQDFKKLFEHGPVILDGATGSNLMKAGMPKVYVLKMGSWNIGYDHPASESLCRSRISDHLCSYFRCKPASLWQIHGLSGQVDHYNHALVALSKKPLQEGSDRRRISPRPAKWMQNTMSFFLLMKNRSTALVDAGVDLLIAETMISADRNHGGDRCRTCCLRPSDSLFSDHAG